jgi:hypothetical protein
MLEDIVISIVFGFLGGVIGGIINVHIKYVPSGIPKIPKAPSTESTIKYVDGYQPKSDKRKKIKNPPKKK